MKMMTLSDMLPGLWSAAEDDVTALLGTQPEQQSFAVMPLSTAFPYGKHDSSPFGSDPTVSL